MARNTTEGMSSTRALMLGGLVVVAIVGACFLMAGDDADEVASDQPAAMEEEEVLEVHPLVPRGSIKSASWHKEDADAHELELVEPEDDGTISLIEASGLGEDEDKAKARKSLENVVSEIHGLGVYVAPADSEDKAGRKK